MSKKVSRQRQSCQPCHLLIRQHFFAGLVGGFPRAVGHLQSTAQDIQREHHRLGNNPRTRTHGAQQQRTHFHPLTHGVVAQDVNCSVLEGNEGDHGKQSGLQSTIEVAPTTVGEYIAGGCGSISLQK